MKRYCFLAALLALAITQTLAQGRHETTIRNFWTAVDQGNFDQAAGYLNDDVKVYLPLSPAEPMNKEAYKQLGIGFRAGFPDIKHEVLEVAESATAAGYKGWFSGTNTGALMGNPPTNKRVSMPFVGYIKFDEAGKIVEINAQYDMDMFNAQLTGTAAPNK